MTKEARNTIGVDVGGTNLRVGRVGANGNLLALASETVEAGRGEFTAQLLRTINAFVDSNTVGVGVGIPGRIDAFESQIRSAGYLDIAGLDVARLVQQEFSLATRIENDATMALIAEAGARPDQSDGLILMVTIGTGIGGAILQSGSPWYGGGISGQFGHLVVTEYGPLCKCGRRGCIETLSSGPALRRLVVEAGLPHDLLARNLIARAAGGDRLAAQVIADWASPFQRTLETLVAAFDPQLIVVGGGLGADMVSALHLVEVESAWFGLTVEPAKLGDNAGVIGAGLRGFASVEP